mmetsp:Transcript_35260/g.113582  ORF Transcript_35260/g.113582 Transcript_35260/m.113582 type:complete len:241 (+) Transcript_35260:1408-2130(+)
MRRRLPTPTRARPPKGAMADGTSSTCVLWTSESVVFPSVSWYTLKNPQATERGWRVMSLTVPTMINVSPPRSRSGTAATDTAASLSVSSSTDRVCLAFGSSTRRQLAHLPGPPRGTPTTDSISMPSASSSSGRTVPDGSGGGMPAASYSCVFSSAESALWSVSMTTTWPDTEWWARRRGVYRRGTDSELKDSPSRSMEAMRSVLPAMATIPSAHCSELKDAPASRGTYDSGVVCRLPVSE